MKTFVKCGALASALLLTAGTAAFAQNNNNPNQGYSNTYGYNNNEGNNNNERYFPQNQGYNQNPGQENNGNQSALNEGNNEGNNQAGSNRNNGWQNQSSNNNGMQSNNSRMSQNEIEYMLRDKGYSNFHDVNRNGDTYTIGKVNRYGRELQDVKVDASTGQVQNPQELNEDQAKNLLKDQGFSNIQELQKHGDTITAQAKINGHEEQVAVNRENGSVMNQNQSSMNQNGMNQNGQEESNNQ